MQTSVVTIHSAVLSPNVTVIFPLSHVPSVFAAVALLSIAMVGLSVVKSVPFNTGIVIVLFILSFSTFELIMPSPSIPVISGILS